MEIKLIEMESKKKKSSYFLITKDSFSKSLLTDNSNRKGKSLQLTKTSQYIKVSYTNSGLYNI